MPAANARSLPLRPHRVLGERSPDEFIREIAVSCDPTATVPAGC